MNNLVIKERETRGPPKPLGPPRTNAGVPVLALGQTTRGTVASNVSPHGGAAGVELNIEQLEAEYMRSNHEMLSAMSLEELAKHAEELGMSVSQKSIQIMQSTAFRKRIGIADKETNELAYNKSESAIHPSAPPPLPPGSNVAVGERLPTTEEELEDMKRSAPAEWRRQIEWTLPPKASVKKDSDLQQQRHENATQQALFSRSLNRSRYDRFALDGSKVIDKGKTIADLNTVLSIFGLSQRSTEDISACLVEGMLRVGFCVNPNLPDTQPQDELLQHEQDPEEPGYSFMEISEMFRSEEKHQRHLAINMLTGILKKREDAVSLEPYGLETSSSILSPLSCEFQASFSKTAELLAVEKNWNLAAKPKQNSSYIRRVLTFSILFMCAADLPADLPTLLLWGLKLRLSFSAKLSLLQCLRSFLQSPIEERVSSILWSGFFGVFGSPALPTPHDRRQEYPYESHIAFCFASRDKELSPEDATDNPRAPPGMKSQRSVQEDFALRNRWGRVDAMVQDGDLVSSLFHLLNDSLSLLLQQGGELVSDSRTKTVLNSSSVTAVVILDLVCTMLRVGEKETIEAVVSDFVKKALPTMQNKFLAISNDEHHLQIKECWFQILTEACRRDPSFSTMLHNLPNFTSSLLCEVLRATREREERKSEGCFKWVLRLWRVLLCQSLGMEALSELLLAAQTPSPDSRTTHPHCLSLGLGFVITGDANIVEVLWLLEQAAVTCSCALSASRGSTDDRATVFAAVQLSQQLFATADSVLDCLSQHSNESSITSSGYHFIASLLGFKEEPCPLSLADIRRATMTRGQGLMASCSELVKTTRQANKSIDAQLEHMGGFLDSFLLVIASRIPSLLSQPAETEGICASPLEAWCSAEHRLARLRISSCLSSYGVYVGSQLVEADWGFEDQAPNVADGLFAWKLHRLSQLRLLNNLQRLISVSLSSSDDDGALSRVFMTTLSFLGPGMIGPILSLLAFLIDDLLGKSDIGSQLRQRLREEVIAGLFGGGSNLESLHPLRDVSLRSLTCVCSTRNCVADWVRMPFIPHVPISPDWHLKCLLILPRGSFGAWLCAVADVEKRVNDRTKDPRTLASVTAGKLYLVLKTTCPEHSERWGSSTHEPSVCDAFVSLTKRYLLELLQVDRVPFARENLTQAAAVESFDARAAVPKNAAGVFALDVTSSDSGAVEFCGKLLDSATAPLLDHDVHCCALFILLCPLVSHWKVQQKIWFDLGNSRCLHLLECTSSALEQLVPLFVLYPEQAILHVSTARAIVSALGKLRKPSSERFWVISSVAVHLLYAFIFKVSGSILLEEEQVLDQAKSKFLLDLLTPSVLGCPPWLLHDVLCLAAARVELDNLLQKRDVDDDVQNLGGTILNFWKRARGDAAPAEIPFQPDLLRALPHVRIQVPNGSTSDLSAVLFERKFF